MTDLQKSVNIYQSTRRNIPEGSNLYEKTLVILIWQRKQKYIQIDSRCNLRPICPVKYQAIKTHGRVLEVEPHILLTSVKFGGHWSASLHDRLNPKKN